MGTIFKVWIKLKFFNSGRFRSEMKSINSSIIEHANCSGIFKIGLGLSSKNKAFDRGQYWFSIFGYLGLTSNV